MPKKLNIIFFFTGEVERLLKEYRQNQEMVRRIGDNYYQIIYPVQLRHHEKMGISTREVSPKVRNRLRKRNTYNTVCFFKFILIHIIITPPTTLFTLLSHATTTHTYFELNTALPVWWKSCDRIIIKKKYKKLKNIQILLNGKKLSFIATACKMSFGRRKELPQQAILLACDYFVYFLLFVIPMMIIVFEKKIGKQKLFY